MSARGLIGAGCAALLLLGTAHAERPPLAERVPRALHDIPWYVANPAVRAATLRLCQSDNTYADLPDCRNAANAAASPAARGGDPIARMRAERQSPQYWRENRIARWGMLEQCRRGYIEARPYCAAAAAAE
ncbi:MAG: hypothetical protein NVS1B6_16510 [Steroidobacteraceae bacterium]